MHHTTSQAAAIGAGIGVPIGILLLASLLYLLYRERRTKKQIHDLQAHVQKAERQSTDLNKQVLPGAGEQDTSRSPARFEMDTGMDRGELAAGYSMHEMAGR